MSLSKSILSVKYRNFDRYLVLKRGQGVSTRSGSALAGSGCWVQFDLLAAAYCIIISCY